MSRGHQLTDQEIGQIIALKRLGTNNRGIARALGRSEKIVRTYLLHAEVQAPRKRSGRLSKLKVRDVRRIFRLATVQQLSSKKVAALLVEKAKRFDPASSFSLHYTNVLRALRASKCAKFIKRKKSPLLTPAHKKKRVAYAAHHLNKYDEPKQTIYTDEKKFNLDGLDGCQFCWHGLRKERERFSSSVAGSRSVMMWGGIRYYGKTTLAVLDGRQDSAKYVETLRHHLILAIGEVKWWSGRSLVIFQQDNASIHTSRATMDFVETLDEEVTQWPAKSPDLSPIENVWGCSLGFSDRAELKVQIVKCWQEIDDSHLRELVDGMPTRFAQVILQRGNTVDK